MNISFTLLKKHVSNAVRCFGHRAGSVLCCGPMTVSGNCARLPVGVNSMHGSNIRVRLGCAPVRAGSLG